jgi:general stress protein CsbA
VNRNFLWLTAIGLVSLLAGVLLFNQLQPDPQNKTSATAETPVALH